MATRAGLLREDMRLKTPVVHNSALEGTENSTERVQGKRLRRRN
ncbi:MarR family transcriptional regulator [Escherichia coli]|nr:MarR family transcriptional regulator [Escherichia coli]